MKAAECRRQLNEPGSAEPVLGELTAYSVRQQASKKRLQHGCPGSMPMGLSFCLLSFCCFVEFKLCAGTQTKTVAAAVKGAADSVSNTNTVARGNSQTQISISNDTMYTPPNLLAGVLGNSEATSSSGGDDEQSYPGLEKPLGSQQDLK